MLQIKVTLLDQPVQLKIEKTHENLILYVPIPDRTALRVKQRAFFCQIRGIEIVQRQNHFKNTMLQQLNLAIFITTKARQSTT